jgi:peptidoglycan-N-acetylglucosamine deacetylase
MTVSRRGRRERRTRQLLLGALVTLALIALAVSVRAGTQRAIAADRPVTSFPAASASPAATAIGANPVHPAAAAPATTTAAADLPLPPRWRGRNLTRLPTKERVVALTLDCGGSNAGVRSALHTLRERQVAATFFVTGQFARKYPGDVRAMAAAGHTIGNHSNTHPDFTRLTLQDQRRQIRRANTRVSAPSGGTTRPWFRFPYGSFHSESVRLANAMGYAAIGWTVDSLGWQGTSGGQSVRSVARRVVAAARPGAIVLMHVGANPADGSHLDTRALPRIIDRLSSRGFRFVRLQSSIGAP